MGSTDYMLRKIFKDLVNRGFTNAAVGLIEDDARIMKPSVEWLETGAKQPETGTKCTVADWLEHSMISAIRYGLDNTSSCISVYTHLIKTSRVPNAGSISVDSRDIIESYAASIDSICSLLINVESATGKRILVSKYKTHGHSDEFTTRTNNKIAGMSCESAAFIIGRYNYDDEFKVMLESVGSSCQDTI